MLSKKNIVLTSVTALGAALLVLTQTAGSNNKHAANKLEGTWITKVPGSPMVWTVVYAPTDPSGRRAAVKGSLQVRIPADVLFPGLPSAEDGSYDFVGEAVMTGPDTSKGTIVGYAIKKVTPSADYPFREQVQWIWVASGEAKFTGPGKTESTGTMAIYLPEADADGDGLPDPGQKPILSFPSAYPSVRVDPMLGFTPPAK